MLFTAIKNPNRTSILTNLIVNPKNLKDNKSPPTNNNELKKSEQENKDNNHKDRKKNKRDKIKIETIKPAVNQFINFPKDFGNFNGFEDVTNAKSFQQRISTMKLAEANKLDITVPGRTDYTVGQKVGVVLNRIEPFSVKDKDTTDKMFSGYYLIAAINHHVDREKHECHMQLIKESSQMDMNRNK